MCYSLYSKCYTCNIKHGFVVRLCPSGRKGIYCIDPSKVVDGKLTVTLNVQFAQSDPDGEPRGCASPYGFSEDDPISAFMEVQEVGAYCAVCATEHGQRMPSYPPCRPMRVKRATRNAPIEQRKKRRVLGDITSKAN